MAGIIHDNRSVLAPIVYDLVIHSLDVFLFPKVFCRVWKRLWTEAISLHPEFGIERFLVWFSIRVVEDGTDFRRLEPLAPNLGVLKGGSCFPRKYKAFQIWMLQYEPWQILQKQSFFDFFLV